MRIGHFSVRPPNSRPGSRASLWAWPLDVAVLVALGVWCRVAFWEGFHLSLTRVDVRVHSRWRVLLVVLAAAGLRVLLAGPPRWLERLTGGGRPTPAGAEQDAPRPTTLARWWQNGWVVLLVLTAAWALMTWPQARGMGTFVADPGDPYMKVWQLDWVAHQLPRAPAHLYDANIFYPEASVLAYTDAIIAPSIMGAPFIWMGVPAVVVFNVLLALGMILSGMAVFGLVRHLTGSFAAGLIAGLAFAFLPYRFDHYAHLELQLTWGIPLAVWALDRVCRSGRLRDGLLLGLAVGLQTLCSIYYGVFLGIFLLAVGPILWWVSPCRARSLRAVAAGAAIAVILVLPAVLPHVAARGTVGERSNEDLRSFSATPTSYLAPDVHNRLYSPSLARFGGPEKRLFPGFVLAALALVGLWPLRSARRWACLVGLLVAFDASLGTHGHVYQALFELAPPFRGLRVPARFGILTAFALTVLAGYGVTRLLGWLRHAPARVAAVVVLIALVLVEYRSFPLPLYEVPSAHLKVYDWLARQPRAVIAELPANDEADFSAMYWSRLHWQPLLNGQSGFFPPWYRDFQRYSVQFPDAESVAFLKSRGVKYVVVNLYRHAPRYRVPLIQAMSNAASRLRPVIGWADDQVRVYEIR
jgi:hypothetical protein